MKRFFLIIAVVLIVGAIFGHYYIRSKKVILKDEELHWFVYQPQDTLIFSGSKGAIDTFVITKNNLYNSGIELFSIEYEPHGFNNPVWAYTSYLRPRHSIEGNLVSFGKGQVEIPTPISIDFETFAFYLDDQSVLKFDNEVIIKGKTYIDVEVFHDQHNTDNHKLNNWGPRSIKTIMWSKKNGLIKYINWEGQEFVRENKDHRLQKTS